MSKRTKGHREAAAASRSLDRGPAADSVDGASSLLRLTEQIAIQEDVFRQGGGPAGRERQRKLGRLTARQRLEKLLDTGAPFTEIGLWAAYEMYPDAGDVPAAGVITGVGRVSGRSCMVVANDATVKAGAFFPATVKKVLRAKKIAARCNLPLVYLVNSAGVYLPMQDEIFPDEDDFGRIFRNNAVLSAMGVPQYSAVMGNCVAGGAYLPVLSDKLLMTSGSALYLAGPALVKAAIGEVDNDEELGGAAMHAQLSGTVDFHEPNDESCLERLRSLIALLPQLPSDVSTDDPTKPARDAHDVYSIVSGDGHADYDVHDMLTCVVDDGTLQEYKSGYGKTLVCAYASLGGRPVGLIASQRALVKASHGVQIGGVIYDDSADKAARFVMDCSQTQLPILFFQDVQGFMVGRDSEQRGIIRSGAKLVNAVSNATVPKVTVIVGGSFGAGNYALCGKAFDPHFIFAWPGARYAVMGAQQAAGTLLSLERRKAEKAGQKLAAQELESLEQKVMAEYEARTDIRFGAARGWVDAIIAPHTTRRVLIEALRAATRPPPAGGFRGGVMQV